MLQSGPLVGRPRPTTVSISEPSADSDKGNISLEGKSGVFLRRMQGRRRTGSAAPDFFPDTGGSRAAMPEAQRERSARYVVDLRSGSPPWSLPRLACEMSAFR